MSKSGSSGSYIGGYKSDLPKEEYKDPYWGTYNKDSYKLEKKLQIVCPNANNELENFFSSDLGRAALKKFPWNEQDTKKILKIV